ncbi:uncharacterized protein LOC123313697 [Coccinella septempunctata]|uniref:uncharacterized protein LOC123313697 n=1 Tax=Coccinella septempunctata TaxID=41139 RepID=UPI001D068923|nr:uncharacterized protein LOC123313697 [Coccinella septempunctata]
MEIPASLLMSSGSFAYVAVKASLHASETAVFGLNNDEMGALSKRFGDCQKSVINGISLKVPPMQVVNALGLLGYRVVGTTGETEVVWTLQRDL